MDFREEILEEKIVENIIEEVIEPEVREIIKKEKTYEELVAELKEYRLSKSREEKVKPYFIYTNEMMEEIIRLRPRDKKELIEIKGFGPVKIDKYGQDIVDIVKE